MAELSKDYRLTKDTEASKQQIVIPYDFRENQTFEELNFCVIPVYIEGDNNKQIIDLLVDTGAQITVLTQPAAKMVGIEFQGDMNGCGIGKAALKKGRVKNIEIGNATGEIISLGEYRVAIGQLPNKFAEYNILGLLGAETIQQLCLKIDYPSKYLELSKLKC